jgi:hypothetical protein
MIPGVTVQEAQETASHHGVHDLFNSGQAERMLFACTIFINIISTHPPIFILFWYTYLMKPASNNLSISLFITSFLSWAKRRRCCLTGLALGST